MLNALPQVIKPAISPSLLGKARRFFNNSPVEILSELLQNSRRAGATQVQINHYPVADGIFVSVKDNGSGIANPSDLLTLGGSGWEKAVRDREDPAGCGFFSLVALGGIVRSHNWRVEIKPETFDELGASTVKEEADVLSGTEVSLVFPMADAHTVQTAVIDNVRYYPVPTLVNGQPAEQSGFLKHALSRVARHGIQIGVMVQQHRFRNVNFYGHSFCHNAFPTLVCGTAWDVENASELQLVRPARRDFVQNGFYEEMLRESEIALYRYIAILPSHQLDFEKFKRAQQLGIHLKEAVPELRRYDFAPADSLEYSCRDGSLNVNCSQPSSVLILEVGGYLKWQISPTGRFNSRSID